MESIYSELALSGSKNECARTDTVFFPISEVSDGTVSLSMPTPELYRGCLSGQSGPELSEEWGREEGE